MLHHVLNERLDEIRGALQVAVVPDGPQDVITKAGTQVVRTDAKVFCRDEDEADGNVMERSDSLSEGAEVVQEGGGEVGFHVSVPDEIEVACDRLASQGRSNEDEEGSVGGRVSPLDRLDGLFEVFLGWDVLGDEVIVTKDAHGLTSVLTLGLFYPCVN